MGGIALQGDRLTRDDVEDAALIVLDALEIGIGDWMICGSYRRGKTDCGDVDIVILDENPDESGLNKRIASLFGRCLNGNPKRTGLIEVNGKQAQVELKISKVSGWGAAVLMATGPGEFNIIQRRKAKKMGYLLNEYGLWQRDPREYICGKDEHSIFAMLGMEYLTPQERERYK